MGLQSIIGPGRCFVDCVADCACHIVTVLAGFIPADLGTFDVPPKRAPDPLPRDALRSTSRGFVRRFGRRRNAVCHDPGNCENEWMRRLRAAKVLIDPQHLRTRALRNSRFSRDEVDDALERWRSLGGFRYSLFLLA